MPDVKCFVLIAENVVGKKQMGAEMAHAFDSSNTTEGYFFGQRSYDMLNGGVEVAFRATQEVANRLREIAWRYNGGAYASLIEYDSEAAWLDYAEGN